MESMLTFKFWNLYSLSSKGPTRNGCHRALATAPFDHYHSTMLTLLRFDTTTLNEDKKRPTRKNNARQGSQKLSTFDTTKCRVERCGLKCREP